MTEEKICPFMSKPAIVVGTLSVDLISTNRVM